MKVKILLILGAVAGVIALALRRRNQKAVAEAELWAEATDHVAAGEGQSS